MKASKFWQLLINPFTRIAGWRAFLIGLVFFFITTLVGYWGNAVPVGILSIKPVSSLSVWIMLKCQLSILAVLVLVVYAVSLVSTKHVRFQDVLGITTLSQAPLLLSIAVAPMATPLLDNIVRAVKEGDINAVNQFQTAGSHLLIIFLVITIVTTLVWYFIFFYNGFKTLTDLKGTKAVVLFIIIILLCDIFSSLLIALLTNGMVNRFSIV